MFLLFKIMPSTTDLQNSKKGNQENISSQTFNNAIILNEHLAFAQLQS